QLSPISALHLICSIIIHTVLCLEHAASKDTYSSFLVPPFIKACQVRKWTVLLTFFDLHVLGLSRSRATAASSRQLFAAYPRNHNAGQSELRGDYFSKGALETAQVEANELGRIYSFQPEFSGQTLHFQLEQLGETELRRLQQHLCRISLQEALSILPRSSGVVL